MAGSWKPMNSSQLRPDKGKQEEGMTREHASENEALHFQAEAWAGGRGAAQPEDRNRV